MGAALLAGLVVLALAAYIYDQGRRDLIAPGVTIAGVDVGGLHTRAARERLRGVLGRTQTHWITIQYRSLRIAVTPRQVGLKADINGAVEQALRASRGGWFVSRALAALAGNRLNESIPIKVTYSHSAVTALLARVRAAIDRPVRNASIAVVGGGQLVALRSLPGRAVDTMVLGSQLARALDRPAVRQTVSVAVRTSRPAVSSAKLASEYPTYIVIDRPDFRLRLYQHLRLSHTYPIAVGMAGLQTPPGLHHILDKQVNPSWHVPHSAWAGSLAGQVIPPGPADPLVARWMAIDAQGDGIHGTNEPGSIGSAASHGCIRMLVPDVIELYDLTPLGSPVYVL